MRKGLLSLAAAVFALSTLIGQQAQPPNRGLTAVPAPVGPEGAVQDLYAGSYALLVGVSKYDNAAAWAPLESIPQELDELARSLRQAGFDKVEQVNDPTGTELRQAVEEFMGRYGYQRDTRLLFFFAGHGFTLENGARGYFVPRDTPDPLSDEQGFRRRALSMQQINTWAGELVSRHALFAFDSCFSGSIFLTRNRVVPARISALTQKPARLFLSAGSAGQTVPAKSVFIPTFIRGLGGAADLDADGYVTGSELGNYVQGQVMSYGTGQTPQFGKVLDPRFDEGDLVFMVPGGKSAKARPAAPLKPAAPQNAPETAVPASLSGGAPGGSSDISADVARRGLASRNIVWSAGSLASALASADTEVLDLFVRGRAEPGMLLEALGSSTADGVSAAQVFFDRAKGNPRAMEWLKSAFGTGLDPNATVRGSYYKREALVHAAVRAGNAPAVLALLDAGASPHGYQEVLFTRYEKTRFIDPFGSVLEHDTLSDQEKKTILERFLKVGGFVPGTQGLDPKRTSRVRRLDELRAKLLAAVGVKLPENPGLRTQSADVCRRFSWRPGSVDWCAMIGKMPVRVLAPGYRVDWRQNSTGHAPASYHDFNHLEIVGLMTVLDGRAYFMGVERDTYRSVLDVVEVGGDGRTWRVYRYMNEGVGMGLCQAEGGYQPRECWRRISMTFEPDKKQMLVENYYKYGVEFASDGK